MPTGHVIAIFRIIEWFTAIKSVFAMDAQKVICFPPLEPILVRRSAKSAPVNWTACKGPWHVSENEAIALMSGAATPDDSDGAHRRVSYRCPKPQNILLSSGEMELRRCTVCTRKDRYAAHNSCKFNCEARFDAMIPRKDKARPDNDRDIYTERVMRAVCTGGMRLGVSCKKLESKAMLSMVTALVQVGIDAQATCRDKHQTLRAEDIARPYSRISIESMVRQIAADETQVLIREYQKIEFINIKIDAGTVLNSHVTHAIADSPWGNLVPWVLDVQANCRWDTSNYEQFLIQHLQTVSMVPNLCVCSVVHDNLAAQSNAVATVLSTWDSVPRILDIPCLNHMANLVFKDSVDSCYQLESLLAKVKKWQSLLQELGLPSPPVPETRWFYIVELIEEILKSQNLEEVLGAHPDVAARILGDSGIKKVPSELFMLYDILEPMYTLSKSLECQSTRLSHTIPLIRCCMQRWRDLLRNPPSEVCIVIINSLISNLLARLRANAFEEIVTAYVLSIKGKQEISHRLSSSSFERCRACVMEELLLAMKQYPECFEMYEKRVEEIEESVTSSDDHDYDTMREGEPGSGQGAKSCRISTITRRRNVTRELYLDIYEAIPVLDKLEYDFLDDCLGIAVKCLENCGCLEGAITEGYYSVALEQWIRLEIDEMINQLQAFYSCESSPQALDMLDLYVWKHISCLSHSDSTWRAWAHLSKCAMRLVSAAVSEADVERLLSKQKLIQGNHSTNISTEGLTARLQLYGRRGITDISSHENHS